MESPKDESLKDSSHEDDRSINERLGDPKCWDCGIMNLPPKEFKPNRCPECLEKLKDKPKFVFVRIDKCWW